MTVYGIDDYTTATIPKFRRVGIRKIVNGTRILSIPKPKLMAVQRGLHKELLDRHIPASKNAHAYILGRDIRSMARPHIGKKYLVRIDIKNFFPTVSMNLVTAGLIFWKVPNILTHKVMETGFVYGGLPQGSPLSPMLSNIAMGRFDASVRTLLKSWHKKPEDLAKGIVRDCAIEYTRYADDLIFSSNYRNLFQIVRRIKSMLAGLGMKVNDDKVFCLSTPHRLEVCGVVVNDKLSKSRAYRRDLRSALHRLIVDRSHPGQVAGYYGKYFDINFDSFRAKIAHVTHICRSQGIPLKNLFDIALECHTKPRDHWSQQTHDYVSRY